MSLSPKSACSIILHMSQATVKTRKCSAWENTPTMETWPFCYKMKLAACKSKQRMATGLVCPPSLDPLWSMSETCWRVGQGEHTERQDTESRRPGGTGFLWLCSLIRAWNVSFLLSRLKTLRYQLASTSHLHRRSTSLWFMGITYWRNMSRLVNILMWTAASEDYCTGLTLMQLLWLAVAFSLFGNESQLSEALHISSAETPPAIPAIVAPNVLPLNKRS